ncbi:hypothetical protein ATY81_19685 [Rhizobium sp. R72]|nr:hypothetical protein ATY81_19685 [Rhizobium sp. R72]OWW03526.1 hypothetical protein ATY80_19685 [Rhizobium sp. R711]
MSREPILHGTSVAFAMRDRQNAAGGPPTLKRLKMANPSKNATDESENTPAGGKSLAGKAKQINGM